MQLLQISNFAAAYLFSLIGLLIVFYLLQGRRKQVIISSIMLWESDKVQEKSEKPKWIFKPDILFFLQLLILILLIIALMRPQMLVDSDTRMVIVIDRSASMQSTDVSPDRFSVTINEAVNRVQRQEQGTELALIAAAANPGVIVDFTTDKNIVIDHLNELQVTDTALNDMEALKLADAKLGATPGKILFYTDRKVPENYETGGRLEVVTTGTAMQNVGITNMDIRRKERYTDNYQVLLEIENFTSEEREIPIIIENEEEVEKGRQIVVAAGNKERIVFDVKADKRTPLTIKLDIEDGFQIDNYAYAVIGTGEKLRFLKIGPENYFLNSAFSAHPELELVNREQVYGAEYRVFDLVIYDGVSPPDQVRGKAVFIKSLPTMLQGQNRSSPDGFYEVSNSEQTHPLLQFVNLNQFRAKNLQIITPPADSVTVIDSAAGPLLIAGESAELKWLYFAFAFQDSTMPLQVSFPVFIDNMVKWFFPQVFVPNYSWLRAGSQFEYLPRGDKSLDRVIFAGREIDFDEGINNYMITDTLKTGLYQLEMNDGSRDLAAVNLLSSSESNPESKINIASIKDDVLTNDRQRLWRQLWPFLLLLVVLLLMIEWYYYHRPALEWL